MSTILGISAFYHDSAAVLLVDGEVCAAAHEERFTRKKHDASFPANAVRYVLEEGGTALSDLEAVAFYDKPFLKFERLLETYHAFAPRGLRSFLAAMPVWIKEKMFMRKILRSELDKFSDDPRGKRPELLFPEHHLSHAASAFYPSPFAEAAILTIDGVGEWATTTIGHGNGKDISVLRELAFPHSLGLLYSAVTYYCGFKVNSGEYKLMGLAPYGDPGGERLARYKRILLDELVDLRDDGSLLLNLDHFDFATGLTMCRDGDWLELFGIPRRSPESEIGQEYMDLALAVQQVTEEAILRMAKTARSLTGACHLVMAGGVALNCVANGKLAEEKIFDDIWVQPAAGDAGGALGAALAAYHIWRGTPRRATGVDHMAGSYLGPAYGDIDIGRMCRKFKAKATIVEEPELYHIVAGLLADGQIVGWFQGRMEYGPRALGNRSILADPRRPEMQKKLNLKIKYREGFRPFAPSVLVEDRGEYFDLAEDSPYMLFIGKVNGHHRLAMPEGYDGLAMYERLYLQRSDIPAVTHVDYTARIQTVSHETNPRYWRLIKEFKELTGCGVVVNTSFNVRGEPIVCSPEDAYRCFMRTEMDYLAINNFLFRKKDQPGWNEQDKWKGDFESD